MDYKIEQAYLYNSEKRWYKIASYKIEQTYLYKPEKRQYRHKK